MTKELSKQICEKCGIEFHRWYENENDEIDEAWIDEYLDFGQPDNFVKLMELEVNDIISLKTPLLLYLKQLRYLIKDRRSFLIALNEYLHFSETETCSEIKQSIREAEWKYE